MTIIIGDKIKEHDFDVFGSELPSRKRKFFAVLSALIFSFAFTTTVFAAPPTSPYAPGETLNPTCGPTDTNCTVEQIAINPITLNYGIGTSSPYAKLGIWGNGTGTGKTFEVANNASTTLFSILDNGLSYFLGNLGIGTTSPSQALSVNGLVYSTGGYKFGDGTVQTTAATGGGTVDAGAAGDFPYYAGTGSTLTATSTLFLSPSGNIGISEGNPSLAKLQVQGDIYTTAGLGFYVPGESGARNAFYRGGTDFQILRNYNQEYTVEQIWSPPGPLTNQLEATLALVRGDEPNQEYLDLYNNGYTTETQFGIRIQKRGTGVYRDFVFDQYDGVTKTPLMIIKANTNVGIGTTTPQQKLDVAGNINVSDGSSYMYNESSVLTASTTLNNYFFGGSGNLAITGTNNTGSGYQSLLSNTTGFSNTANGVYSLDANTTGFENTAMGYTALRFNTSGFDNVAVGTEALFTNTTGFNNTASGRKALLFNTSGSNNTASGMNALAFNSTGNNNTANGVEALYSNTTGYENTSNGYQSLYFNTTGFDNAANGQQALYSNTTGYENAANGFYALKSNTVGYDNSANGAYALTANTTGYSNTGSGAYALNSNSTGTSTTALGYYAGASNTTGSENTFIGMNAGYTDGTVTTPNNLFNATAIGYNAQTTANNSLILGGTGAYAVNVGIGTTTPSTTFTVVGSACVAAGGRGPCSTTPGTITAATFNTASVDLAERYNTDDSTLAPGEITMLDPNKSLSVMRASKDKDATIFGVVSTEPGVVLGSHNTPNEASTTVPIALSGRVPLKVVSEGGVIQIGDKLTLSSTPGAAMKASGNTAIIGTALENFSGAQGTILAFVNIVGAKLDKAVTSGTIGDGQSSFWGLDQTSGRLKYIAGLDLNDFDMINVKAIRGSANKWSIDAFGNMIVGQITANKLCIGTTCIDENDLKQILGKGGVITTATTPNDSPVVTTKVVATSTDDILQNATTTEASTPSFSGALTASSTNELLNAPTVPLSTSTVEVPPPETPVVASTTSTTL